MKTNPEFSLPEYSRYDSSPEILQAIHEAVNGDPSAFDAVWDDPEELDTILTRAWELADDETDRLFWGWETFYRPGNHARASLRAVTNYDGANIWQDIIVGLPGYDEAATAAADPTGRSDVVVFSDGSRLVWIQPAKIWLAE